MQSTLLILCDYASFYSTSLIQVATMLSHAQRYKVLCHKYGSSCFTLCHIVLLCSVRGGERHTYTGDRTTAGIVGFGRRVAGPLLPHVETLPTLPYMPTAHTGREKEEGGLFVYVGEQSGELWVIGLGVF